MGYRKGRRRAGQGAHQQLTAHDGLTNRDVDRDIAHMQKPHPTPRLHAHEPIQYLLQLCGNGTPITLACGLIDEQSYLLALLLPGLCDHQRSGLWGGYYQYLGGERHCEKNHVGNARTRIQYHHVVVRNQAREDA